MTPERKKELRAFYWNPGEVQTIVDELLDEIERLERIVDAETIADLEAENARLSNFEDAYRAIDDALDGVVITTEPTGNPCVDRIASLRAEVAAMRPVVEAAREIDDDFEVHGRTWYHRRAALSDALHEFKRAKGGR